MLYKKYCKLFLTIFFTESSIYNLVYL